MNYLSYFVPSFLYNFSKKEVNQVQTNEASYNEATQNEVTQNEVSQNEVSQNEASYNEVTQNEVTQDDIDKECIKTYNKSYVYALNNDYKVPPAICKYLGISFDISMTRKSLTALLYRKFKNDNLFDKDDKHLIHATNVIKDMFYMKFEEELRLNNLQDYLTRSYCMNRDFI
jgi:hypothetical protein